MNPAKAQSSKGEFDPGLLLSVLTATKKGDFSARMPLDWIGIHGKIADTLNDIIDTNDKVWCLLHQRDWAVDEPVDAEGRPERRLDLQSRLRPHAQKWLGSHGQRRQRV